MLDPLEQFRVYTLIPLKIAGIDVSVTNCSLWMFLVLILILTFLYCATRPTSLVPTSLQMVMESFVAFVEDMTKSYIGATLPYFALIFSVFIFIGLCNVVGLIPGAFTVTSQLIVTAALAFSVFLIATCMGIYKHKAHFFSFFIPKNVPTFMVPFLVVIESLSYLFRPISLAIRLFANMVAGHVMLKIFSGFAQLLGKFWGMVPISISVILLGFEVFIAVLQAYVFALLTCIYFKDALYLH